MKLRIFTEPQQGADYQTLRAVALAAEELGFDAFFRSDHYLARGPGSARPGPTEAPPGGRAPDHWWWVVTKIGLKVPATARYAGDCSLPNITATAERSRD